MWNDLPISILQRVRDVLGYRTDSVHSGTGFDIKGMREYEPGDTPRSLSRKHYLRTTELLVLEKHSRQGARVLFLLDASASFMTGAVRSKYEASLELLHHLGLAYLQKGHTLKIMAFTTTIEYDSPAVASPDALEGILDDLAALRPLHTKTDPRDALDRALYLASDTHHAPHPVDQVCLISDFALSASALSDDLWQLLSIARSADVIALLMRDRMDTAMPPADFLHVGGEVLSVRDAETGFSFIASGPAEDSIADQLEHAGIDTCTLTTGQSESQWYDSLSAFYADRHLRGIQW